MWLRWWSFFLSFGSSYGGDGGVGVETVENISAAPLDSWDSIESIEPGTEPEARREPNAVETVKAEEAGAESPPVATPEPTLDRMGRLHRPDGTIMPKEEAEAYKAANPAKPIPATPESVAAAAAPEKANDLPTPVPWTFRAKGQDVTPEGAQHIPGHGVFIPEQFVPNFRQAFAHHIERDGLIRRNTQIQQEFEQANQKGSVAVSEVECRAKRIECAGVGARRHERAGGGNAHQSSRA